MSDAIERGWIHKDDGQVWQGVEGKFSEEGLRGARGKGIVGVPEEVRSFENFRMQEGMAGRGGSPEIKRMVERGFEVELGRDEMSGKGDGEAETRC